MKYVYLTLNWLFGVLLGLIGLISLLNPSLLVGSICLITISLLLLPPARNAVYAKTEKKLSFKARATSIFVLFIIFSVVGGQFQEKKAAELGVQRAEEQVQKLAKAHQDNIDYFSSHREEIISSASSDLSEKNYQLVMNQTRKYLPARDAELNRIYNQAKNALEEIKKAEREAKEELQREAETKGLVARLKTIPASEFKENKDLYQQLVELNPENTTYRQKFDHYSKKLTEKLKTEARIAKFGEPLTQIAWGEPHYVTSNKLNVRLAPNKNGKITNALYKRQKVEVFEIQDGWARISDYYGGEVEGLSGSVARWVFAKYLSTNRPAAEKATNLNSPVAKAIKLSDDLSKYQDMFISVSEQLVKTGKCALGDLKEEGGWSRSINHKPKPVYFTYCGGISRSNRIYLNAETGKIFRY